MQRLRHRCPPRYARVLLAACLALGCRGAMAQTALVYPDAFSAAACWCLSTDNPGSPNLQAGLAKLPIYTVFGGSAGLGHRFSRFDLSIKGDAERTVYQNSELTDGSTVSNEDRNYDQYSGTLRGGHEPLPGVTPFAR